MRILVSTLTPYPAWDAHVVHITATARGFADAGHDVTLVAAQAGPGWPDGIPPASLNFDIRVLARRNYRGQSLVNGLRLWRIARRLRPDLCFADDVRSAFALASGGAPVLIEFHSMQFHTSRLGRAALRRLVLHPALRGIITISEALRDDVAAAAGLDKSRITVAPEAARPRSTDELRAPVPDWLTSSMRSGALQVGYTGSLFGGRGVDLMIELARRSTDIDLHVLGGPEAQADLLRQHPERPPNLHVHGVRPVADAERMQATMDVLLAPYANSVETPGGTDTARWMSPMKVFEYLASGRPMVCSDLPVLREVLVDGETALLATPDDVDAWAQALARLAADSALRDRIGARGREVHLARFTWAARTDTLLTAAQATQSAGGSPAPNA
jgi:glycosyltransferase involved in cell wall biosynthesis